MRIELSFHQNLSGQWGAPQIAAALVEGEELEPTRSVLHRSAATLALDCGEVAEAERLAKIGLRGSPPTEIAEELREVLEQSSSHGLSGPVGLALVAALVRELDQAMGKAKHPERNGSNLIHGTEIGLDPSGEKDNSLPAVAVLLLDRPHSSKRRK